MQAVQGTIDAGEVPGAPGAPADTGEVDAATLARAQARDPAAMTAFVRRYERRVYALVFRLLAGRPEAREDVAQECFLKVLRALPRFEPDLRARPSTWVLTIATRTCLDVLRRPDRVASPLPGPVASAAASPEESAAERQLGRRVEAAMARLPEEARAVLVLRAYHDFDYDEIAAALGLPVGTVKSRLGRARDALRAALEEEP